MLKRTLALALAVLMVFSMAACGNEGTSSGAESKEDYGKTKFDIPDYKPTDSKVKLLTYSDPVELKDPTLWMYIVNEKMKIEYGCEMEYIRTTSEEIPTKASQLVLSGQSPDLIQYRAQDDPSFVKNNLVQPFDEYIDFNEPIYKDLKEINDSNRIDGKIYSFVRTFNNNGYTFWWVKDLEDAGLESPRSLYLKGEWTWSKLAEYAKILTKKASNGAISRYGVNYDAATMHTVTGESFVKYEDGKYTNNLKSSKLAEFFNYTSKLTYEEKVRPIGLSFVDSFSTHQVSILIGAKTVLDNQLFEEQKNHEISYAPSPRWDSADKYYVPLVEGRIWLAKGAKNVDGALAHIAMYCLAAGSPINGTYDEELRDIIQEANLQTKGERSEEDENISAEMRGDKFTRVKVYDTGLGVNWCVTQRSEMINNVQKWNKSWASQVEKYYPLLDVAINETYE